MGIQEFPPSTLLQKPYNNFFEQPDNQHIWVGRGAMRKLIPWHPSEDLKVKRRSKKN
jgi:hypothetical protein